MRVLVAMSGGIDSAATVLLLKEMGYNVVGVTLKIWDNVSTSCNKPNCCSLESILETKALANSLNIEHHVIDVRNDFKNSIIKNFICEYLAARTPNPCVLCNSMIKWSKTIALADSLNCEKIATGHYSYVREENGRFYIQRGVDNTKDQSYVLWQLTQEQLYRTLLPLGGIVKKDIRKYVLDKGYDILSKKKDSQGICFIPNGDYRPFLRRFQPELDTLVGEGSYYSVEGRLMGKHKGYPFYTIGQRKGLNIAVGHPLYVVDIEKVTNKIILGEREHLLGDKLLLKNVLFQKYDNIIKNKKYLCKIRYNHKAEFCIIEKQGEDLFVKFESPVESITSGQSGVIYDETGSIICGGIIMKI